MAGTNEEAALALGQVYRLEVGRLIRRGGRGDDELELAPAQPGDQADPVLVHHAHGDAGIAAEERREWKG